MKKKFLSFLIAIFMFIPAIFMSACGTKSQDPDKNSGGANSKPKTQYEEMTVIADGIIKAFNLSDEEVQTVKLDDKLFSTSPADFNRNLHNELVRRFNEGTPCKYPLSETWFKGMCVALFSVPIGCGDILETRFKDKNLYDTVIRVECQEEALDGAGQPIQNPDGSYQMITTYQYVVTKSITDTQKVIYLSDEKGMLVRAELEFVDEYNFSFSYTDFELDEHGNVRYIDWCYGDSDKHLVELSYLFDQANGFATWFDGLETYELESERDGNIIAAVSEYTCQQIDFEALKAEIIAATTSYKYTITREEMDAATYVYVEDSLEEQASILGPFAGGVNAGMLYHIDENYTGETLTLPDYIDSFTVGLRIPSSVKKIIIPDNVKYVKVGNQQLDSAEGIDNVSPDTEYVPINYEYATRMMSYLFEVIETDPDRDFVVKPYTGEILFSNTNELLCRDEKDNYYIKLKDKQNNPKEVIFQAKDISGFTKNYQPTKVTINTSDFYINGVPRGYISFGEAKNITIYSLENKPIQINADGKYQLDQYRFKAIEDGYYYNEQHETIYIREKYIYVKDANQEQQFGSFAYNVTHEMFKNTILEQYELACISGLKQEIYNQIDVSVNLKEVEIITDEQVAAFGFVFKDGDCDNLDKVKITFTKKYEAEGEMIHYGEDYLVSLNYSKTPYIKTLEVNAPKGRMSIYDTSNNGQYTKIEDLSINSQYTRLILADLEIQGSWALTLPATFTHFGVTGSEDDSAIIKGNLDIYTESKICPLSVEYDYKEEYFYDEQNGIGHLFKTVTSAETDSFHVDGKLNLHTPFTIEEIVSMKEWFRTADRGYVDEYSPNYHQFYTYLLSAHTDVNVYTPFGAKIINVEEVNQSNYKYKSVVSFDVASFDINDYVYYSLGARAQVVKGDQQVTSLHNIALASGDNIFTITISDEQGDSEDIVYTINVYRHSYNTVSCTVTNMDVSMPDFVFNSGSDVKIVAPDGYDFQDVKVIIDGVPTRLYEYSGNYTSGTDYIDEKGVDVQYYRFIGLEEDLELAIELAYKEYNIVYNGKHMASERTFTSYDTYTMQTSAFATMPTDVIEGFVVTEWYDNEYFIGEPITSLSFEGKYETIKLWAKIEPIEIDIRYEYSSRMTHRFTTLPTKYARIMYEEEYGYWSESIAIQNSEFHQYNSTLQGYMATLYHTDSIPDEYSSIYSLSYDMEIQSKFPNAFIDGYITIYVDLYEIQYQFQLLVNENWDSWEESGCVIDEQALPDYEFAGSSYCLNYTVENDGFTLPTVTKSGYNFVGWKVSLTSQSNLTDGSIITELPSGTYGSFVLIVQFEPQV